MANVNTPILREKNKELSVLLDDINNLFEPVEDEFLNEMFYSSIYKAKEFSKTLEYLLERSELK